MGVAIFGSCVTRDLFEDPLLRHTLGHYAARSSVVSVVAPPMEIDEERVALPSPWQRRCVLADVRKSFFAALAETGATWLVIDLIDERFDLLRTERSFVTRSSAYRAAGLEESPPWEVRPVSRMSEAGRRLFEEAAVRFAQRVAEVVPPERVIVHRALWCTRYRAAGDVRTFSAERLNVCTRHNAMLEHGYDALERAFGGRAAVIGVDLERHLADADHKWQLEPYHYDADYHREQVGRVHELLGVRLAPAA
jgi:hypothetical protein